MTYSAFCFGPTAFYWYPFIESMFPGSDAMSLCIKVLMDQIIYSPVLLSWFWFHSTFLSTMDINQSIAAIPKNVMASLISSWCYWPLVQIANIGYVPAEYQVLVINVASIPWNMYVSYSVSKQEKGEKEEKTTGKPNDAPKKKKKKRKED